MLKKMKIKITKELTEFVCSKCKRAFVVKTTADTLGNNNIQIFSEKEIPFKCCRKGMNDVYSFWDRKFEKNLKNKKNLKQ
ncbi:hypothetical protein LCGC14_3034220 [marine sediment metagenome]|uniref:Uncharacterized protein n=1 Tax=marine sediment metagenome TaxID=412755 RepID=A0A0F8XES6_9ZZZZ